jgi:hypothetical protein
MVRLCNMKQICNKSSTFLYIYIYKNVTASLSASVSGP